MIDSLGRRKILMGGSVGGAISMYFIGAYIAIANPAQKAGGQLDAGGRSAGPF